MGKNKNRTAYLSKVPEITVRQKIEILGMCQKTPNWKGFWHFPRTSNYLPACYLRVGRELGGQMSGVF